MTTFTDWWDSNGLVDEPGASKRRVRALCQIAWDAGADERAKRLRAWEGMADANLVTMNSLEDIAVDRALRREPPADVEELIQRLNTRGGVCHREHAELIRQFVRKGYSDDQSA